MKWNTFRARVTLWNVAVLALVLGGFALAVCGTIQGQIGRMVDRDLADQARHEVEGPRSPRRRGGPHRRERAIRHPSPDGGGACQPGTHGKSGFRLLPGAGSPAPSFDSDTRRVLLLRRPRFLNREGEVVSPPWATGPLDAHTMRGAMDGRTQFSTVSVDGERVRVLSMPWIERGRIVGAVQVGRELGGYDRLWHSLIQTLLALLPAALLAAGLGGLFLTDRALRPVRRVTQAAAQIGAKDLSRRLEVAGRDELAELAVTFNGMIARLEAAFEQQRRFTADASHELRTPLARIKVTTSMALGVEQSSEEYRTALTIADQAADAMTRLIRQLLLLARSDAGQLRLELTRIDLLPVLRQAAASAVGASSASVVLELPLDPIEIAGDADHLGRVFINLLENAIRHTPPDGRITLAARAEDGEVVVRVADTGEGIPPEHLPHVCERFYRVDKSRARQSGGSGLGLAISQSIVQAHGGTLSIESAVGRGTTVTVTLSRA